MSPHSPFRKRLRFHLEQDGGLFWGEDLVRGDRTRMGACQVSLPPILHRHKIILAEHRIRQSLAEQSAPSNKSKLESMESRDTVTVLGRSDGRSAFMAVSEQYLLQLGHFGSADLA